jgi:hypothetical protein
MYSSKDWICSSDKSGFGAMAGLPPIELAPLRMTERMESSEVAACHCGFVRSRTAAPRPLAAGPSPWPPRPWQTKQRD